MNTEETIRQVLEEYLELNVEKIPESDTKTPDFLVTDGEYEYLIEVKEKEDNPDIKVARESAFSADELFKISESLAAKSVHQNVVRDGQKQIKAYATNNATLRILWVHCTGLIYDATFEQLISGLYGSETVVDVSSKESSCQTCYYFGFSQFYKYKDSIDAVVVSGVDGTTSVCINNYSPRYAQVIDSMLVKSMKKGIRDPAAEDRDGTALFVDANIDRKKPGEVLSFLQNKYGIGQYAVMQMRQIGLQKALTDSEPRKE